MNPGPLERRAARHGVNFYAWQSAFGSICPLPMSCFLLRSTRGKGIRFGQYGFVCPGQAFQLMGYLSLLRSRRPARWLPAVTRVASVCLGPGVLLLLRVCFGSGLRLFRPSILCRSESILRCRFSRVLADLGSRVLALGLVEIGWFAGPALIGESGELFELDLPGDFLLLFLDGWWMFAGMSEPLMPLCY